MHGVPHLPRSRQSAGDMTSAHFQAEHRAWPFDAQAHSQLRVVLIIGITMNRDVRWQTRQKAHSPVLTCGKRHSHHTQRRPSLCLDKRHPHEATVLIGRFTHSFARASKRVSVNKRDCELPQPLLRGFLKEFIRTTLQYSEKSSSVSKEPDSMFRRPSQWTLGYLNASATSLIQPQC